MYVIRERAEDGQNTSQCSLDRPLPTTDLEHDQRHPNPNDSNQLAKKINTPSNSTLHAFFELCENDESARTLLFFYGTI